MYNFRKIKRNSIRNLQRNSKSSVNITEWLNTINVKLSDSKLNKFKNAVKIKQE